jgi:hypothetical protein
MTRTRPIRTVPILMLTLLTVSSLAAEDRKWIDESNAHARYVAESSARVFPEFQAAMGVDDVDEEIIVLDESLVDRAVAVFEEQIAELRSRIDETADARVTQDLEILVASRARALKGMRARDELLLPYYNVPEIFFYGLSGLLDPQTKAERRPAALVRLRRYAGREDGYRPLTELARERTLERLDDAELVGPYRGEVEMNLQNSPRFAAGLEQMFQASGLEGYAEDLEILKGQIRDYDRWVREVVLPRARDDFRQPGALYEVALEEFGVDATPDALIADGLAGYMEIRGQMEALAPQVATSRGWDLTDYRDVIAELKKEQFRGEEIVERYRAINDALEKIIVREGIVSLPQRSAIIRIASDAEAAAIPVPHLKPPRLVNNEGEMVEFLIPVSDGPDRQDSMSDDTFEAMAWTLAAHELRPGHELQFSAMLDNGTSLARALYAFNSTNVEGWALYAEAEVKPYLPLEGQLMGLQMRLLRAARSFLDPMLNTGRLSPEEARRVLAEDVVITPDFADRELNRYTFEAPGQASAYYYGYRRLLQIRARTELALGDRFDRQSYHDFIIDQGLLPADLLERAVIEEYVPSRSVAAGG